MRSLKLLQAKNTVFFAYTTFAISSLLIITRAEATIVTVNFNAQATVAAACTAVSAATLSFGAYNPSSPTPNDTTNAISVTCTSGVVYVITMSQGTSGSYATRTMINGGAHLNYNIYTDVARTLVWGDGVTPPGTSTDSGTGSGIAQPFIGYGRISSGQVAGIITGSYLDTITLTVTFS